MNWMMPSPSNYSSEKSPLYLDTGVLINLVATGQAGAILAALSRPIFLAEEVARNFVRDPRNGSDGRVTLKQMEAEGVLRVSRMNASQVECFLSLVGAPFPDDLGDAEAATIASAVDVGAIALDEGKGARVSRQYYPALPVYSSLDLICAPPAFAILGLADTQEAARLAIRLGRMRVCPSWRSWVTQLVGAAPASLIAPTETGSPQS